MSQSSLDTSKQDIWKMFDAIAKTYDKANRYITFGLDLYWRRRVSSFLPPRKDLSVLDCATGTADQLISLLKRSKNIKRAVGLDLSLGMLEVAKKKAKKWDIEFVHGSALCLPFSDALFDCVTLSFGIRNVTDVDRCLYEILRTLKPGGRALILETSLPKAKLVKASHMFYLRKIIPSVGGWISKKKYAYQYLNKTAEAFPCGKDFCDRLLQAGFEKAECHPLSFGAVSIYVAEKSL